MQQWLGANKRVIDSDYCGTVYDSIRYEHYRERVHDFERSRAPLSKAVSHYRLDECVELNGVWGLRPQQIGEGGWRQVGCASTQNALTV